MGCPCGRGGLPVDEGELLLSGVQLAGQGARAHAGVSEEDDGAVYCQRGVLAEVVAELPAAEGMAEVGADLSDQLRQARGGQGQRADDVAGG
jgi:hypothetical protein